jgi:hypothetical protein
MANERDVFGNLGGGASLQPTEDQLQQGSGQAVERVETAPSLQEELHEAGSAHLAIVIGFKGKERTTELRLAPNVITKLALEAQFRGLGISELIGALVAATTEKDLFQLILKTDEMSKGPQKLAVTEIRVFPEQVKTPIRP